MTLVALAIAVVVPRDAPVEVDGVGPRLVVRVAARADGGVRDAGRERLGSRHGGMAGATADARVRARRDGEAAVMARVARRPPREARVAAAALCGEACAGMI